MTLIADIQLKLKPFIQKVLLVTNIALFDALVLLISISSKTIIHSKAFIIHIIIYHSSSDFDSY